MLGRKLIPLLIGPLALLLCLVPPHLCVDASVAPIVVRGRHLVDSVTQQRFFVKGSGYDYVSGSSTCI